ncbi:hypothetical protein ScPMuIL_009160 [Solemya velum]
MAGQLDMANRDPNGLNIEAKAEFEDLLGEPDGTHSIDCVWKNSYNCFTCGKNCCYKFMTTLCGIFIALYWGCEFAMITFEQVWCVTPNLKILFIYCGWYKKCFSAVVGCCLAPLCESCALLFSQITINKK